MIKFWDEITVQTRLNNGQGYINALIYNEKIKVWGINIDDERLIFNISSSQYKKAAAEAIRFGGKTKVTGRRGLYFSLRRYRSRFGILFGILSFAFIIVFLSGFMLDIRISGNEIVSDNQILEHLEGMGITPGTPSKDINKTQAEVSLLLGLERLAWVSVELDGSRLYVKVTERGEGEQSLSSNLPCNIVANKTGRIVETEVYRGKLERPIGSGVAKGELIVSGTVDDGNGGVIYSHADGKIIAECEEQVSFFSPYVCLEKKKNGKVDRKEYLQFLGQSYPLFLSGKIPENSTYHEELRRPEILGLKLPMRIKSAVYTEYEMREVTYLNEEVLVRLNAQIDNYKRNFYSNTEIMSWNTEYIPEEKGIRANVSIVYRIDIAEKSEIYVH